MSGIVRTWLDGQGSPRPAPCSSFRQDRDGWREPGIAAPQFHRENATLSGTFSAKDLIPGDYFVVAVPLEQGDQLLDTDFLEKLASHATRITLGELAMLTVMRSAHHWRSQMTRSIRTLFVALIVAAISASTHAQQPMRDLGPATRARIGTAVVAGLVTLGDDAKTPVRRAVVTLTAADDSEILAAISGDDGKFTIERVPAGKFTLAATKPAYLTIPYGAHRPGRRGTMLVVAEGQHLNDLNLSLPLGAVLAGLVTLPDGQPAQDVQMMAIPTWLATTGGTPPAGARVFKTNDLGEFRLFGLTPDTYVVTALPSFGRGEVERMSDSAISDVLRQLQQPGSTGTAIGSPTTLAYAPTYFPGTPSVGEATRVTVERRGRCATI